MSRAVGYDCRTACFLIDSAHMDVSETGGQGVGDDQCNRKKEVYGSEEKWNRMGRSFTGFFMYLDQEFHLKIDYRQMLSSSMRISVNKQMYRRPNEAFGNTHKS
jgi:hypothetical protein